MSQQNFYEKYAQLAIDQQIKYGIPASITLQQMALESGHGKSDLAVNYNNYFGVKAGSSWKGPTVMKVDDHSYPEAFRVQLLLYRLSELGYTNQSSRLCLR